MVAEQCWDFAKEFYFGISTFITTDHVINLIHYTYHTATHCHITTDHKTGNKGFQEAAGPCEKRSSTARAVGQWGQHKCRIRAALTA